MQQDNSSAATSSELICLQAHAGAGQRLDQFLARQLPQFSRSRLQRWIALGAVTCETRGLSAKTRLTGTEVISVEPQPLEAEQAFAPEPVPFDVLYEDSDVLVINKRAGLVVHPAPGNWQGTLMNGLLHRYVSQRQLPRAGIVHRLDKDTSGLMVVARNDRAMDSLVQQLGERTVSRRYLAVCIGSAIAFQATGSIGRDSRNRLRMAVRPDGKPALTDVTPLATGAIDGRQISILHCRLHTGRTHQIRVHCAVAGHPLVGDSLYGGANVAGFSRQALHAYALRFDHPQTGEPSAHWSAPPADWTTLLEPTGWAMPSDEHMRALADAEFPDA